MKTTDNCYVAQIGLTKKPNKNDLDPCGPIPFLEVNYMYEALRTARSPLKPPSLIPSAIKAKVAKRYLQNATVGEDFAPCYETPTNSSRVLKKYVWEQQVLSQCYEGADESTVDGPQYWLFTTDFCYLRSKDLFESPSDCKFRQSLLLSLTYIAAALWQREILNQ